MYHQNQGSHFQEVAALSLRNSLLGSRNRTTNTDVISEGNTPPSKPYPLRTLVKYWYQIRYDYNLL